MQSTDERSLALGFLFFILEVDLVLETLVLELFLGGFEVGLAFADVGIEGVALRDSNTRAGLTSAGSCCCVPSCVKES